MRELRPDRRRQRVLSTRCRGRWGRWATYLAVIGPLPYAAVRWAWALGIPLGITKKFFREGQETGLWWAGAALSMVDLAGAFLTLGLVQH